jgi:FKBP-type peptidyl-prolyl cis-trans isomerase (trigger factor)
VYASAVVAELVDANELQAKPEQLKTHIEELAASYEKPQVVRWYLSDNSRMAESRSCRDRKQRGFCPWQSR